MTTAELRLEVASIDEVLSDAALRAAFVSKLGPPWGYCIFCGGLTRGNVCIAHQDLVE